MLTAKKYQPKKNGKKGGPKSKLVKEKETKAQLVARKEGQNGEDTRVQAVTVGSPIAQMGVALTDPTIDVRAERGPRTIEHLAMGIVLTALGKGWMAQTRITDPTTVYAAYVYLVQSFYAAMLSTVPQLQQAPLWYWAITQALAPTTTKFKTSAVTYKWQLPEGVQQVAPPNVEDFGNGLKIAFGRPGINDVNEFKIIESPVYTPAAGEDAIKSMFEYTAGVGMGAMSPYVVTPMKDDVSVFSVVYPEMGSSPGGPGGMATTIYSEKKIHCPLLAQFCEYQTELNYRGWAYAARGAGTPGYVIPRMLDFGGYRALRNQITPIFKFYDFDEFFEVLSLILGYALEQSLGFQGTTPVPPCPLTPQQAQILLRQTIIPNFSNHMAQDMSQTSLGVTMVPFSVGTNGVSITAQNGAMKLPMLFAENIRSVNRRTFKFPSGELDCVPILGRRQQTPQLENYTWAGGLVYTPTPGPLIEFPIDLISCSAVVAGTEVYLDLNEKEISSYTSQWNEWITKLANYLTPLTTPGQSNGPAVLSTLTMTRHVKFVNAENVSMTPALRMAMKSRTVVAKKYGKGLTGEHRVSLADPVPTNQNFTSWTSLAITSTNKPLKPVWKYQRVMIVPVYYFFNAVYHGGIPHRQVFQVEPFRISSTTSPEDESLPPDASLLLNSHKEMALFDVKSELAAVSEIEQDFQELNRLGDGGFFSSLAGMFAEDVLGLKGGRAIAGAVGDAFGI